jgi:uncharacterized protein YlxW (UPF0749 family)
MSTSIRCVGPTITVNSVRLAPPYIVKAIGSSQELETGLKYNGGFMDTMSPNISRGVSVKIMKKNNITIPAYRGSLLYRYAQPSKEKEK